MAERLMDIEDMPEEEAYAQARAQYINRTEPRLIEALVSDVYYEAYEDGGISAYTLLVR